MKLKRHKKLGVFLTPEGVPTSLVDGTPQPYPQWMSESQENYDSWLSVFNAMASECNEMQPHTSVDGTPAYFRKMPKPKPKRKRKRKRKQKLKTGLPLGPVAQRVLQAELPKPEDACLTSDKSEVILCLADAEGTTLSMPVKARGSHWISLSVSQALWTHWRVNTAQMKALGFTARKEAGIWCLQWSE